MAGEKPGNLCLSYAGAFKVRVGKGETDEKEAGGKNAVRFACFCVSPQLTCVHTKFIANGLFTKYSQQVDLRAHSEVIANLTAFFPPASFSDFCCSALWCIANEIAAILIQDVFSRTQGKTSERQKSQI